jgi:hypothetical protein
LSLAGTATAYCGHTLNYVHVVVARRIGNRCSFLHSNGVFGKATTCSNWVYLKTTGTSKWTYALSRKFPAGTYYVWDQAVDNKTARNKIDPYYPSWQRTIK